MRACGHILSALGRHGPVLLVLALALGCLAPTLAADAHAILPLAAFLLTLGSFLSAGFAPPEPETTPRSVLLVLAWAGLGAPLLVAGLLRSWPLDPDLRSGVLLTAVAPPVGSAAAIAAMLGLRPRLALATSIGLTVLAPVSIPGLGALIDLGAAVDVARLATHLALIVVPAALVAALALRTRTRLAHLLPSGQAASGVAVVGLVIVGLAMADGVRAHWTTSPSAFLTCLAMAVAGNLGLCIIGAGLFARRGRADALTAGLVGGNRNVTLAWAAAGSSLPAAAEAYVAASIVPILALPLVLKLVLAGRGWAGRSARLMGATAMSRRTAS